MCGVIFTDPRSASYCYYGLHYVLTQFDLSDNQRAEVCACIAAARDAAVAGGVVLFEPRVDFLAGD